jgi:transcriptional regulator with XRE-family HTH domain
VSIIESGDKVDKVGRNVNRTRGGTEMSIDIGLRLLSLRNRRGRTREWVSERIGVTPQQIQRWEVGLNNIPIPRLRDICIALEVNWGHFLDPIDARDHDSVIQSKDALELIKSFEAISDSQVRRTLVDLVRMFSEKSP